MRKLYETNKNLLLILNNYLNDVWKMHDFNYQLPKETFNEYWDEECILHPINSNCTILMNSILISLLIKIKKDGSERPFF